MPRAERGLRRHDLVWLAPAAWERLLDSGVESGNEEWLARWAASDWPLVVRRRALEDTPGMIAAGLPLPASAGKARIACVVAGCHVLRTGPPPSLVEAMGMAPVEWQSVAHEVLDVGRAVGIVPRVFGSLAWACVTGLDYIGPRSDLDLIWSLGEGQDPAALLRALLLLDRIACVRLDGEIVSVDGQAVHWAELASGVPEVMVKTVGGIELVSRCDFLTSALPA